MQVTIEGQKMNVGDALRAYVQEKLENINTKYFNRATDAEVTFKPEGHSFVKVNIFIRVAKDIKVLAEDIETDPYAAFDIAAARIAKQLRRYKRKLRDHHERQQDTPRTEALKARDYILAREELDQEEPLKSEARQDADFEEAGVPPVVAEVASDIHVLSVSDAVMRMELAGENALLFHNAKTDRLNMVYRRTDGNIGWIDPEATFAKSSSGSVNAAVSQPRSKKLKSV